MMLARIDGGADMVVGSRYAPAGASGGLGAARLAGSRTATLLTRLALGPLSPRCHDPLSGYFLVRREALGMLAAPLGGATTRFEHVVTEARFDLGDRALLARCALVPAGAVVDVLPDPVAARGWLLDVDVFEEGQRDFDPGAATSRARQFAEQAYRFFRWSVTDAFLRKCGGKP